MTISVVKEPGGIGHVQVVRPTPDGSDYDRAKEFIYRRQVEVQQLKTVFIFLNIIKVRVIIIDISFIHMIKNQFYCTERRNIHVQKVYIMFRNTYHRNVYWHSRKSAI